MRRFERAILHCARISRRQFTIGFPLNTAFSIPRATRAYTHISVTRFHSSLRSTTRDCSAGCFFSPCTCTPNIFLREIATEFRRYYCHRKTRRYEIIERTVPSSRVSFSPRNRGCNNVEKHITFVS